MTTKTNKTLKKNQTNNLGKLPIWDLGDLYNSTKDNKIKDLISIAVLEEPALIAYNFILNNLCQKH